MQGRGVFVEVVRAVVLPQPGDLVTRAVVEIEEEIDDDAVDGELQEERRPRFGFGEEVEWRHGRLVRDQRRHDDAKAGCLMHLAKDLAGTLVGNAVAIGNVTVETAVYVGQAA